MLIAVAKKYKLNTENICRATDPTLAEMTVIVSIAAHKEVKTTQKLLDGLVKKGLISEIGQNMETRNG